MITAAEQSPRIHSFDTLRLQREFISPSADRVPHLLLSQISFPHIESYNSLFNFEGGAGLIERGLLSIGRQCIVIRKESDTGGSPKSIKVEYWLSGSSVSRPVVTAGRSSNSTSTPLFPKECRERFITYNGKIAARLNWRVDGGPIQSEIKNFGSFPIMIRSARCRLLNKSPKELIDHGENAEEFGGYFICNGLERIIRLLVTPRRNHAMALVRASFQKRGPEYTQYGVAIRCVCPDQSSQTLTLHYLEGGYMNLRFHLRGSEYLVPVALVLRALVEASDKNLYDIITAMSYVDDTIRFYVENLLNQARLYGVYNRSQCLTYLGRSFVHAIRPPEDLSYEEAGVYFLRTVILIHLTENQDKFNMLIYMIQKLYSLSAGKCSPDDPDTLNFQEILLPGHILSAIIKEKFKEFLHTLGDQIKLNCAGGKSTPILDGRYMLKICSYLSSSMDIGKKLEYFLNTGNIVSRSGLDLMQSSGYTMIAERLNFYRYISHFRSVHRGSFFVELKTTAVRKLLPESWGFLCPVHTPDGSPCGLLNHLSHKCMVVTWKNNVSHIAELLTSVEVSNEPPRSSAMKCGKSQNGSDAIVSIQLDGKILGWCTEATCEKISQKLRHWRLNRLMDIPPDLEIGYVPSRFKMQYPGLFLFSDPSRLVRQVEHLRTKKMEMIGPFEQIYLNIACVQEDVTGDEVTHIEALPTNILSIVANLTPFSDFNQSPRNMYQCQMAKQTMGTPFYNLASRTDNKSYHLQTGQTPVVRPKIHSAYGMDNYPNGINAVVCVISYTGYDMEDGLVLNRASVERGMSYGSIRKTHVVDLAEISKDRGIKLHFGLNTTDNRAKVSRKVQNLMNEYLDKDGLPRPSQRLENGVPLYSYVDENASKVHVEFYRQPEIAYVEQVCVSSMDPIDGRIDRVSIKLRIPRPPAVGDKFSARHGQKGVVSQLWDAADMPFTESGIIPDIIINPHAFPSRMTIGMLLESLAGKSGALHGKAQDSTPWRFTGRKQNAADYFGDELQRAGFNFHGNETMYSGISGTEMTAGIYIGIVYYQRLRHMVSDKYQVRISGPVHDLTRQPVKGRSRDGGIRFGEMERDSLLAHGASYLLHDRLLNCSDRSYSLLCRTCGSLISSLTISTKDDVESRIKGSKTFCSICLEKSDIVAIVVPYVLKYFCAELASAHMKMTIATKS